MTIPKLSDREAVHKFLLSEDGLLAYVARTSHRLEDGKPIGFLHRSYLWAIYASKAAKMVFRKSVQNGISEYLLVRATVRAGWQGKRVFYVLPDLNLRNKFVQMRVEKRWAASKEYTRRLTETAAQMKAANNVGAKLIGDGGIVFDGSNSKAGPIAYDADEIIIDELDKCRQEYVTMSYDRYAGSLWKRLVKVGNPSFTGFGISEAYDESDRRVWKIRCAGCNHWQALDWFASVVAQTGERTYEARDRAWSRGCGRDIFLRCVRCDKPLDRLSVGEWVAEFPDREVEGYTISQLFSPTTTIERLLMDPDEGFFKALQSERMYQLFINSRLGLPYSPRGTSLDETVLKECSREYGLLERATRRTTMGVDVGAVLNVRISDYVRMPDGTSVRRAVRLLRVHEFEDLDRLMVENNVQCCVVDFAPETRKAREFQRRHPGKVWLCRFQKITSREEFELDMEKRLVVCDRTQIIDSVVGEYLDGRCLLPRDVAGIDGGEWMRQMVCSKRILDESSDPPRYVWDAGTKADHYLLADVYDLLARKIVTRGQASSLAAIGYKHSESLAAVEAQSMYSEVYDWLMPEASAERERHRRSLSDVDTTDREDGF